MTEHQYVSLQDLIDATPDLVGHFHANAVSPHTSGRPGSVPIPAEFTNWRDEQRAWRESVLMMDFSHHRKKVALVWDDDDIRIQGSLLDPGIPFNT